MDMNIEIEGRILSGTEVLDSGITDIVALPASDGWALFTTSGRNGGLAGYELSSDGSVTLSDTTVFPSSTTQNLADSFALPDSLDGGFELVVGTKTTNLGAYKVDTDGEIGAEMSYSGVSSSFGTVAHTD